MLRTFTEIREGRAKLDQRIAEQDGLAQKMDDSVKDAEVYYDSREELWEAEAAFYASVLEAFAAGYFGGQIAKASNAALGKDQ